MKIQILLLICLLTSLSHAQTAIIAYKSHSGSPVDFFIDPSGNFGDPPLDRYPITISIIQEKFKPLNDSVMIVETTDFNQKVIKIDTLPNHQRYSQGLFETKYKDSIRKKENQELNLKIEQAEEQLKPEQIQSQQEATPIPSKKKKKSYLLFLFGITGGGMLLTKLFGKSKVSHSSIA